MAAMTKRSRHRRAADVPVATRAPYGPDTTRATKLVVSILQPGDRRPRAMRTWTTEAADVRFDPGVAAEAAAFVSTPASNGRSRRTGSSAALIRKASTIRWGKRAPSVRSGRASHPLSLSGHAFKPAFGAASHSCRSKVASTISAATDSCQARADASCTAS